MQTETKVPFIKFTAFLAAAVMITSFFACRVSAGEAICPITEAVPDSSTWEMWPQAGSQYSETGVLIDVETGALLYSLGGFEKKYPASLTKLMTAILVVENDDLDDKVTMTAEGVADAYDGSSNIQPTVGESFSVLDCLKMLLVKSANDVATQLAVFTSGSVEAFAELMNERAASLGCLNTHFTNASGLHEPDHYSCCYDMALILAEALKFDVIRDIMSQFSVTIDATPYHDTRVYETHIELMKPGDPYYEYCIAGKTGNTDEARSTLACAAQKDGRTLCAVVMDVEDTLYASADMIMLFDYGFDSFTKHEVYDGVPKADEGGVILPNGVSFDDVDEIIQETDGYVLASYDYGDHYVGHALMTSSDYYNHLPGADVPEKEVSETSAPEDESSGENLPTSSTASAPDVAGSNAQSGEREVNTAGIVIACVVIAAGAVVFFLYLRAVRRERERKRREARRRRKRE